jgi:uncharacterized protein (TIGR01777 family)
VKILISGASGLIGSALIPALLHHGDSVSRLVRRTPEDSLREIQWDPASKIDVAVLSQFDAVIHLAARTIGTRWSEKVKREARESRVVGTSSIAQSVAETFRSTGNPGILVSAAAVGYYGSRGDEVLMETSGPGIGFLADLAHEWEDATKSAADAGVRVALPRISMVLSKDGGGLPQMITPFKFGVGGRIGSGRQWMSWVSIADVVAGIRFALTNSSLCGPFNLTSPQPVTNSEFVKTLGKVLHRPAIVPLPAPAVRMMFGEMGDSILLGSSRVIPTLLEAAGFRFRYPELSHALRAVLGES